MIKLKNRGNLFVVIRHDLQGSWNSSTACAAFADLDDADDYKGACEQEWRERVGDLEGVDFDIQLTTYYG